jgi:glycosyltransferase involved in cell wall biosynthesis
MTWYKLSDLAAEMKVFRKCWRQKVDIIHCLDGEHSMQFLPTLLKRLPPRRPKLIGTYHQPPELLGSLIIKDLIGRLDCVTVVSPEQVSYFSEFVVPHDKIRLILHGIDVDFFRPGNNQKDERKFKCITVGHYLRDLKTLRKVAEKLSSYKNIEFHLVSARETEVEDLANVIIHKSIDDASLLELYQQADILFLPLLQSTANNALLEGIACGLPVISTYLPSVKAYLPGKEAILVEENHPDQFVEAILHLYHNSADRSNMAREARKRAEELDWRNIAPQFEAVYSHLVNQE